MKISRVKAIVIATVFGLFSVAVSPAAAQDFPTSNFNITFGNSFLRGQVTWFNRSVGISYEIKSATGCKTMYAEAWNSNSDSGGIGVTTCAGQSSKSDSFTLSGASAGGFVGTEIFLVDESGAINDAALCERPFAPRCIDNDF